MDFRITCDGNPQDIQDIKQQLAAYNQSRCPDVPSLPLGIFYEDEAGRKLAGITGDSSGDWLCIDFLFVSEALRGQGIGQKLLTAAEEEGRKRGCKQIFLYTWSFQAPGFYEKMGYRCGLCLEGFPVMGNKYFMIKTL